VGEMGEHLHLGTEWTFNWRRHLFMWEEELLISLKEDLDGMVWSEEEDGWRWSLEELGVFTVKSAYNRLEGFVLMEDKWRDQEKRVFESLWENPAPSKVVAFVWKVLLDRIPSKVNLAMRHVIPLEGSTMCTLCALREETSLHLLLH
jgi:hypothetical protein